MEKIITIDNLRDFAYCNLTICKRPIRGIVVSFFGLNGREMYSEDTPEGIRYAGQGILYLVPYQNPWAWMNRHTVAFTDELIDVLVQACGLPDDIPVVSTGGSMGGLSALVYTAYAARTPVACVANCPVCDLPFHYTERPDLPRTLYSAFFDFPGTLQQALESASPLHLVGCLPKKTAYYIFHCEQDMAVNKQQHSDRFVAAMQSDYDITYYAIPERGHCQLTDDMRETYHRHAMEAVAAHQKS